MKPVAVVFCELNENESFCAAVVRELGRTYEVRACGPGWPAADLGDVDTRDARFYLELDAVTGNFVRPRGLDSLPCPKFAWLVDTHKKTEFQRQIARDVDLTFFAHRAWGHVFDGPGAWLPLHADLEVFRPVERERDLDLAFVGSQTWRAEALERIARRHGLRLLVTTTTGPREKSETAAIYARAKLVFNRHCTNDLNFRVFEAMACGRVLLTDAQANGQYELFEEDRHYALYKDERDLERQVLRLLSDDPLRASIERQAAALAAARHSTRARTEQLIVAIEGALGARVVAEPGEAPVAVPAAPVATRLERVAPGTLPRGRWLVVAGDEPSAVVLRSYAERLGDALRGLGQEVRVARVRRRRLDGPEPWLREIDLGPLPAADSEASRLLVASVPLQRALGELSREEGPFQAVLVEGALGGLLGPPLAARLGVPLVLALSDCEVERRRNLLTREQVHVAELERWGAAHAAQVLVPTPAIQAAVRARYGRLAQVVPVPVNGVAAPARPERLLGRLGLAEAPLLLLGQELGAEERAQGLSLAPERSVLWAGQGLWSRRPGRAAERLALGPVAGPALAALLACAECTLLLDRAAERRADALALARLAAVVEGEVTARALGDALEGARHHERANLSGVLGPLVADLLASSPAVSREARPA